MMAGRLADKVVVISGAAGGQGRVAAEIFAREGARLVLNDVDAAGLETVGEAVRRAGGAVVTHAGDLTLEEPNRELVDLAVRTYGRLDVMYNNAGRVRFSPIHETSLEDWNFTVAGELTLVFLGCKHALRQMLEQGEGSIINLSSTSGLYGTIGHGAHAATKAGVVGLTRQIAVEYGARGIRCNAIAPGYIDHPGVRAITESMGSTFVKEYPLGRYGRPEDPVYCALYLASDEASFVTGQVFIVDGGKTAH
jgi:NAD(P)-dependent dehydrogenase (short-subunit alcohol dehydrogenase family)